MRMHRKQNGMEMRELPCGSTGQHAGPLSSVYPRLQVKASCIPVRLEKCENKCALGVFLNAAANVFGHESEK